MSRMILNGKTQSVGIDEPKERKTLQGSGEFTNLMTIEQLYGYFDKVKMVNNNKK